jgi:hypothetical protein
MTRDEKLYQLLHLKYFHQANNMKNSGRIELDIQKDKLIAQAYSIIFEFKSGLINVSDLSNVQDLKESIKSFRKSLGYDRGTEYLEERAGWKTIFNSLEYELTTIIDYLMNPK